jgi:hypothetical protein
LRLVEVLESRSCRRIPGDMAGHSGVRAVVRE